LPPDAPTVRGFTNRVRSRGGNLPPDALTYMLFCTWVRRAIDNRPYTNMVRFMTAVRNRRANTVRPYNERGRPAANGISFTARRKNLKFRGTRRWRTPRSCSVSYTRCLSPHEWFRFRNGDNACRWSLTATAP